MDRTRGMGVYRTAFACPDEISSILAKSSGCVNRNFGNFRTEFPKFEKFFAPPLKKKRNMVYLALNGSEEQFFGEISVCFQFFLHL